jgi:hypothetical protein
VGIVFSFWRAGVFFFFLVLGFFYGGGPITKDIFRASTANTNRK